MPCDLCPHCTAPPVLRLPRVRKAGDHVRYDRALLDAYAAAKDRSRQPVRLLVEVNPWLSRSTVAEQLTRARSRGATGGPDGDAVQQLLGHPATEYLLRAGQFPGVEQVMLWDLAATEAEAEQLLKAARKVHDSVHVG